MRFSIWVMSASASSKLMVSASPTGSTLPFTWCTLSSSKHRMTCSSKLSGVRLKMMQDGDLGVDHDLHQDSDGREG